MLDGVAMKPSCCGGLLSNRRQIELCQTHGLMWLGSGLTDPNISLVASLGLYAAYGLTKFECKKQVGFDAHFSGIRADY